MSGGVAFVYDDDGTFERRCNASGIILEQTVGDDRIQLKELLRKHAAFTGSDVAVRLLDDWAVSVRRFVTVVPKEYRQLLAKSRAGASDGAATAPDAAVAAARIPGPASSGAAVGASAASAASAAQKARAFREGKGA
jgi:hypothetical protein